jgi:cobalamin synthase
VVQRDGLAGVATTYSPLTAFEPHLCFVWYWDRSVLALVSLSRLVRRRTRTLPLLGEAMARSAIVAAATAHASDPKSLSPVMAAPPRAARQRPGCDVGWLHVFSVFVSMGSAVQLSFMIAGAWNMGRVCLATSFSKFDFTLQGCLHTEHNL